VSPESKKRDSSIEAEKNKVERIEAVVGNLKATTDKAATAFKNNRQLEQETVGLLIQEIM
jgi:hypothetical protein